jgi:hypothetical protein
MRSITPGFGGPRFLSSKNRCDRDTTTGQHVDIASAFKSRNGPETGHQYAATFTNHHCQHHGDSRAVGLKAGRCPSKSSLDSLKTIAIVQGDPGALGRNY